MKISEIITDKYKLCIPPTVYYDLLADVVEAEEEQEPKTGHWNCGDDMFEYAICSSCKHETGEAWEYAKRNFKYCPNCGAKMVEPQESETWNGIHAQITAPKGTFERIFNEADDDNNI